MKKINILILVFSGSLLIACSGKEKKEEGDKPSSNTQEASFSDAMETVGSLKEISDAVDDIEAIQKHLAELKPVSHQTFKKIIPKSLIGLERVNYSISSNTMMGGMLMAESTYENDTGQSLKFSVMDGAGKASSSYVAGAIIMLHSDLEEVTEKGFTKTMDVEGRFIKIVQKTQPNKTISSSYEFVVGERFLVTLEGHDLKADKLREAYDELDFSALKD